MREEIEESLILRVKILGKPSILYFGSIEEAKDWKEKANVTEPIERAKIRVKKVNKSSGFLQSREYLEKEIIEIIEEIN